MELYTICEKSVYQLIRDMYFYVPLSAQLLSPSAELSSWAVYSDFKLRPALNSFSVVELRLPFSILFILFQLLRVLIVTLRF